MLAPAAVLEKASHTPTPTAQMYMAKGPLVVERIPLRVKPIR